MKRQYRKPKIDVVPLIDVLMVLLIILLPCNSRHPSLNVKLPKIGECTNIIRNELVISVMELGETFVNGNKADKSLAKIEISASSSNQWF